jgi:DNA repair photolyase
MRKLDRKLYSASTKCKFGCRYCFAKFEDFDLTEQLPGFSVQRAQDNYILYPTCDAEFFANSAAVDALEDLVGRSTQGRILVSISVKSRIGIARAKFLRSLNERLSATGRGLIKCSISLSTKYQIETYEPLTPGYESRMEALEALSEEGIPTSVNLKPVLPMIPVREYEEIVDDTARYVQAYLVGGLYIDPASEFGRLVNSKYGAYVVNRRVDWLPSRPEWKYCENPSQTSAICAAILAADRKAFETDVDLVGFLFENVNGRLDSETRSTLVVPV